MLTPNSDNISSLQQLQYTESYWSAENILNDTVSEPVGLRNIKAFVMM